MTKIYLSILDELKARHAALFAQHREHYELGELSLSEFLAALENDTWAFAREMSQRNWQNGIARGHAEAKKRRAGAHR